MPSANDRLLQLLGNVYSIRDGRTVGYAPTTINRRLAAISGLFSYRQMRDGSATSPVPHGPAARRAGAGEHGGLLAHLHKPKQRSRLRVREPRRLPRGLDRKETTALLASLRTERDRAIAGLMLLSGLRSRCPATYPLTPTGSSRRRCTPRRTGCAPMPCWFCAPPGCCIGELLDLELDCVPEVPGARTWLKVPLGKLDTERMVPIDDDTLRLVDRIVAHAAPASRCHTRAPANRSNSCSPTKGGASRWTSCVTN